MRKRGRGQPTAESEDQPVEALRTPMSPPLSVPPGGRRRPWGWILTAAVAGAAAVAIGVYAAITYQDARNWQAEAEELRTRVVDLEARRDELSEELTNTREELSTTRSDLGDVEGTLERTEQRLANVTAQREQARDEVARLADERDLAAVVGADLSTCVDDLFNWLAATPSYLAGQTTWNRYFAQGDAIANICGQARGNFDAFIQALQQTGR